MERRKARIHKAKASELMSQLWRQTNIVSSWQAASAIAEREKNGRITSIKKTGGERGAGHTKYKEEDGEGEKNHSFRSECSVRCFRSAFASVPISSTTWNEYKLLFKSVILDF